jgi:hypothetical protein
MVVLSCGLVLGLGTPWNSLNSSLRHLSRTLYEFVHSRMVSCDWTRVGVLSLGVKETTMLVRIMSVPGLYRRAKPIFTST